MSKQAIQNLIDKYETDREHYLSSAYNETQLRTDFLDPFFEALGWDINNKQGKSTNEREVLLEEPLKAEANSNTKKPDYTFRLFSERKFYVEAKKPNVSIENEIEPAKQVRRYGFTARLKISVLSNFEYLAIYDCSQKVEEADQVNKSRVKLYHYTEYAEAFDDIVKELGREGVYNGEFDEVWSHIEEQLKLFSVDNLFVNQINDWRLLLGKEIYSHKAELSADQLNDIVQRYINSIIFLRVCEDRNLEEYKTLLNIATEDNFSALVSKFSEADKKYNAGLFNHELTSEIIENNKSAFWSIIQQLYYPESTYSFSIFASDILGNIYEIFLSQELQIQEGEVVLENKPEHINRDVVTTPTYIINDILRNTVKEYCSDKDDKEILSSTFADIACGSGAFLLETFQLLNDTLVDYYLENDKEKLIQTSIGSFKLPFEIKREILEKTIYGVDKDFNAVQACKFGLLLKLLEDENNNELPVPALPNLSENINFGNSLITTSDIDEGRQRSEINPFDFGDKKIDVIVGNPPYMSTEDMKQITPLELPIYKKKFDVAFKQFDKYFLFVEQGYNLLQPNGYFGYIIPSKFTKVGAGKKLREFLKKNKDIKKFISFGFNQIFQDKTTYTGILILQKEDKSDDFDYVEVEDLSEWKTRNLNEDIVEEIDYDKLDDDGWVLVAGNLKDIYEEINNQSISLGELVGDEGVNNGIQTSANPIYIHAPTREDQEYFYFEENGEEKKIEREVTRPYFQTSSGQDGLYTYRPLKPNAFVIYPYFKDENGNIKFVDIGSMRERYPNAYEYLLSHKDRLEERDVKPEPENDDEWYRYGRHQALDRCDVPAKIVVGVLSQGDKYAIDYEHTLISSGGTAGYCMITLPEDSDYSIYYIQALLNSKYLEWYSSLLGEVFRGGYIARGTKVLKKLPIRKIDFENNDDKEIHDKIAKIQEDLISLQTEIDLNTGNDRTLTPLKRQFDELHRELDRVLKELFGLREQDELVPLISKQV